MATTEDGASATIEGQSKRPSLSHQASDHSDSNGPSTANSTANTTTGPHPRPKHQKQRRVGGLHGRVPSTHKGLHKQHASSSRVNLTRRQASPVDQDIQIPQRPQHHHRRATSELRLSHNSSSTANVPKVPSQSSLKRNRSHVEIAKTSRSSEKLKRSSSGTGVAQLTKPTTAKSQVHFDLGSDDREEDEWVDASGSNSPYLSRKGSLNSSTHSDIKPGGSGSANSSRPPTPDAPMKMEPDPEPKPGHEPVDQPEPVLQPAPEAEPSSSAPPSPPAPKSPSSPERKTTLHKEYLTSRLLQRSTSGSQAAPPKMSTDTAEVAPPHASPASTGNDTPPATGSQQSGLVSRFVEVPGTATLSEGSFYNTVGDGGSHRSVQLPRRPQSAIHYSRSHEQHPQVSYAADDNSALIPRSAKRASAPAEASRTQQKLNLQRASSTIEPGPAVTGGVAGVMGASPLIGVGDAGHDGGNSRDPRVGRLLERHGMEYLVVRRYQNPIARSLNRLARLPSLERTQRVPRTNTGSSMASRLSVDLSGRHNRNPSIAEERSTATARRSSVRANGSRCSLEADDVGRLGERMSGSSVTGREEEEDSTAALLRNLWETPLDLSASTE